MWLMFRRSIAPSVLPLAPHAIPRRLHPQGGTMSAHTARPAVDLAPSAPARARPGPGARAALGAGSHDRMGPVGDRRASPARESGSRRSFSAYRLVSAGRGQGHTDGHRSRRRGDARGAVRRFLPDPRAARLRQVATGHNLAKGNSHGQHTTPARRIDRRLGSRSRDCSAGSPPRRRGRMRDRHAPASDRRCPALAGV